MDRMLDLLGEHRPDFLRQLPSKVQAALPNTPITGSQSLAEEADKCFLAPASLPPPGDTMLTAQ